MYATFPLAPEGRPGPADEESRLAAPTPISRGGVRSFAKSAAPWALAFTFLAVAIVLGVQNRQLAANARTVQTDLRAPSALVQSPAADAPQRFTKHGVLSAEGRKKYAQQLYEYGKGHPEKDPLWKKVLDEGKLPEAWDWRNVSGKNWLAPNRQQHLPTYCGGCWIFSTIHALNDRISIARNASFPVIQLSHQVMINCQDCGNCEDGGDEFCVYGYAYKVGIPDDTCAVYEARTGKHCLENGKLGTCKPDCYCANAEFNGDYYAIGKYRKWYLANYDHLPKSDTNAMKAEIYARGPITCGMCATDNFMYEYRGGIYREHSDCKIRDFDHVVSVSGWGVEDETGEEYWIVRNSWGTFWGEDGWFRIPFAEYYALGIGKQCSYGVVDVDRSKDIPVTPLSKYYKWKPSPDSN